MRTQFFLRLTAADRQVSAADLIKLAGIDQFGGFAWLTNVLKNAEPWTEREPRDQAQEDAYLARGARRVDRRAKNLLSAQGGSPRARPSTSRTLENRADRHARAHGRRAGGRQRAARRLRIRPRLQRQGSAAVRDGTATGLARYLGALSGQDGDEGTALAVPQSARPFLARHHRAPQASDRDRRVSVLAGLGRDSLMESYLWTIHRYHREHEPPAAG